MQCTIQSIVSFGHFPTKCPNQNFQRTRKSLELLIDPFGSSELARQRRNRLCQNRFNHARSLPFRPVSHRLVCCGRDTLAASPLQSIAFRQKLHFFVSAVHRFFRSALFRANSPSRGLNTPGDVTEESGKQGDLLRQSHSHCAEFNQHQRACSQGPGEN